MQTTAADREEELLLAFVQARDAPCPSCHSSLHGLTVARCPECGAKLELTVGLARPRLGWLLLTLVPSAFSGVAALLLVLAIGLERITGGPWPPAQFLVIAAFGIASGAAGAALVRWRWRFVGLDPAVQRQLAVITWVIHVIAFIVLVWSALI